MTDTDTMSIKEYRQHLQAEHSLQALVVRHLSYGVRDGINYFAIPNAAKRGPKLASWLKAEGLQAGVADLVFMLPRGKVAWLELKTESKKSKQNDAQLNFERICKKLGHPYAVARNIDEALAILRKWRIMK